MPLFDLYELPVTLFWRRQSGLLFTSSRLPTGFLSGEPSRPHLQSPSVRLSSSPAAETCREVPTAAAAHSPRCVRRRDARGRCALRPEISSHVGERSCAPPRSNGEDERSAWRDIRTRARVLVPRSLPDVACAPRSPSRPLSRAFPRHPDSDSPASPDFLRLDSSCAWAQWWLVLVTGR